MSWFDFFRRRRSPPPQPLAPPAPPARGWDAITAAFESVYPGQTKPYHRAPLVYRMDDLSDDAAAFDGVSAYDAGDFWHFVTFGLTELYDKQFHDPSRSGFGYELCFRIPKVSDTPPEWAFSVLEAIGRQIWNGMQLGVGHTIRTGPLDGRSETQEDAVLVVRDPAFPAALNTPHGLVDFYLLLGVPNAVREQVLERFDQGDDDWQQAIVAQLRSENAELVTPIRTMGTFGG